jgi:hypothetical protein
MTILGLRQPRCMLLLLPLELSLTASASALFAALSVASSSCRRRSCCKLAILLSDRCKPIVHCPLQCCDPLSESGDLCCLLLGRSQSPYLGLCIARDIGVLFKGTITHICHVQLLVDATMSAMRIAGSCF